MATELALIARRLLHAFDNLDFERVSAYFTADAQAVEEISRRWMRNTDEISDYFAQLRPVLSDVHSELHDIHEVSWGDAGVVTFWLEQTYVLDGEQEQVSAPTTMVFRREGADWKVALTHSIPLPAED